MNGHFNPPTHTPLSAEWLLTVQHLEIHANCKHSSFQLLTFKTDKLRAAQGLGDAHYLQEFEGSVPSAGKLTAEL